MRTFVGSPIHLEIERPLVGGELAYLVMQLEAICPHSCRYCFSGTNPPFKSRMPALTLGERLKLVAEARAAGVRVIAMPGDGEPLAVPGCRDLISHASAVGMVSIIYTKGYLLTPEWAEFLAQVNVTVVLSVDSLAEETATRLNALPAGWFPKAKRNIQYLRTVFRRRQFRRNGYRMTRLVVNHMVNQLNHGEQEAIRDWCEDDMLFVCHGPSREGRAVNIWNELAGDDERHRELIAYANSLSETGGNTTARADGKCAYYLNGITIGANGETKACPASSTSAGSIGTVRTSSLATLYRSTQETLSHIFGNRLPPCLVRDQSYPTILSELCVP